MSKIKVKRGLRANLPSLADSGELVYTIDSKELYIGSGDGLNRLIHKNNLEAVTNPTANDDSSLGYSIKSMWINISTDEIYICVDSTPSNAVWKNLLSNDSTDNSFFSGLVDGCTPFYINSDSIGIESGRIDILGDLLSKSSTTTLTWANIDTGTTKSADTWYFVYLEKDPNTTTFIGFISHLPPTKDSFGNTILPFARKAKYHPTRNARFVGSFRTNLLENIIEFNRFENRISYVGLGYNYIMQGGNQNSKTAVDVSSYVPITSDICSLYFESSTSSNYRYLGDAESTFYRSRYGSDRFEIKLSYNNKALNESGSSSTNDGSSYNATKAFDGEMTTRWLATSNNNQWLQIDFGSNQNFNAIKLVEYGSNITSFNLQYWNGSWVNITTGTLLRTKVFSFNTINARYVRIYINTASNNPSISEFQIYDNYPNNLNYIYYRVDGGSLSLGIHGYLEKI